MFLFIEKILSKLLKPTDLSYIQVLKLHVDQVCTINGGQKGGLPHCRGVKMIFISKEHSFNKHHKILVAALHQPFIKLDNQVQKLRDESEICPKVHICW